MDGDNVHLCLKQTGGSRWTEIIFISDPDKVELVVDRLR